MEGCLEGVESGHSDHDPIQKSVKFSDAWLHRPCLVRSGSTPDVSTRVVSRSAVPPESRWRGDIIRGIRDEILLKKHKIDRPAQQRIVLLEPHGLHHETTNALKSDKVRAFAAFRELGKSYRFSKKRITLDGYIISDTPVDQIPGGIGGKSRDALAIDHAVILAKGDEDWWVPAALGFR